MINTEQLHWQIEHLSSCIGAYRNQLALLDTAYKAKCKELDDMIELSKRQCDTIREMTSDLQNETQGHQAAVNTLKEYIVALGKVEKVLLNN